MSQPVILVLATTFGLAGVAKLSDRAPFEQLLAAVVDREVARWLALIVPAGELLLAVALLAGVQSRAVALITLAVLGAFSWALLRLRAQPRIPSCNCFGSGASDPAYGLLRNAALGALAGALLIAPADAAWSQPLPDLVAAATVALGAACAWHLSVALVPARRLAGR